MDPKVSIIILNWNGWQDTIECLESLYQIDYSNFNVILVDNDSHDDSIKRIKEYCNGKLYPESDFFEYNNSNKPIKTIELTEKQKEVIFSTEIKNKLIIIKNNKNYGFAEGNNIGIKFALKNINPDYILLLNNDTVVNPDFLETLVKIADKNDEIGFAGPKTYYYDYNGRKDVINFAGGELNIWIGKAFHRGYNEIENENYNKVKEVNYVEGSCFLVKREVLDKIGLLDPEFFAYLEEMDLCIRGLKEGFKSFYIPEAKIWHKVSVSSPSKTKEYYMARNRFIFMKKNADKLKYSTFLLFFPFEFIIYSIYILYNQNYGAYLGLLNGIKDGFKLT